MEEKDYDFVVGICDDDSTYRNHYVEIISSLMTEKNISAKTVVFASGEEVVNHTGDLDVLFLDEELADGGERKINGLQVREIFAQRCKPTCIVCITSYAKYMQNSFGYNVMGFIVKGSEKESQQISEVLSRCIDTIETQSNVIYIESYKHEIEVHLSNGSCYRKRGSIEAIAEKKAKSEIFARCHKSYLVNLNHVLRVEGGFSGFIMSNGHRVPIGRTKKEEAKKKYDKFKTYKAGLLFTREDL